MTYTLLFYICAAATPVTACTDQTAIGIIVGAEQLPTQDTCEAMIKAAGVQTQPGGEAYVKAVCKPKS